MAMAVARRIAGDGSEGVDVVIISAQDHDDWANWQLIDLRHSFGR
jgi:hypothetical protein